MRTCPFITMVKRDARDESNIQITEEHPFCDEECEHYSAGAFTHNFCELVGHDEDERFEKFY